MDADKVKLAELMERFKIALERERREESGLTPEQFIEQAESPNLQEQNRRRLVRENRARFVERREQLKTRGRF